MTSIVFYLITQVGLALVSTLIGILVPGALVVKRWFPKVSGLFSLVVSLCTGLAMFGAQGYLFGWMHVRFFGYGYVLIALGLLILNFEELLTVAKVWAHSISIIPRLVLIIILIGVCIQSLQMVGNGLPTERGINFYRTNAYDGIFHIGLIEGMKTTFPPQEPSTIGLSVVNYHYWSDLIMAEQSRLFFVNLLFLFFQWYPIVIALCTALSLVELLGQLTANESKRFRVTSQCVALLVLFLGSDSGWIFPLAIHKQFTFSYPAIDNGPTQFLNMPHAFGKMYFFAIGLLFLLWRKSRQVPPLVLGMILTGITFGLKIYFGISLSLGFLSLFIFDFLRVAIRNTSQISKTIRELTPMFVSGIIFLLVAGAIYLPVNRGAGGLSWYPLEWSRLFVNSENFDWTDLNYRIAIAGYLHNTMKLYWYNTILVAVGLISIYGARVFGILYSKRTYRILHADGVMFFVVPVLLCTWIGMTTLQDSGSFNVFNFFAVSMGGLTIGLALWVSQLVEWNKIVGISLVTILLALSMPRTLFETLTMISRYREHTDVVNVTPLQSSAFAFLRTLPTTSVVATSLEDPLESKSTYIPALSARRVYFAGKYLLVTHNQPYEEKELNSKALFSQSSIESFQSSATAFGITHIWVDRKSLTTPADRMLATYSQKAIFANDDVLLYDIRTL